MTTDLAPDASQAPRPGEELPFEALRVALAEALPELGALRAVSQFPSGHSNWTYALDCEAGEAVLRRPPRGAKVEAGHDMGREHDVLAALSGRFSKAPRVLWRCDDASLIGAPFFVMERVRGVILRRREDVARLAEPARRALMGAAIGTLAEVHALPLEGELARWGKPEGYVRRQVEGWRRRYARAQTHDIAALDDAAEWLDARLTGELGPAALIHNDFKLDNLVLDPAEPTRIIAVLDWEMASVGEPLLDLGTSLGYWVEAADPGPLKALPLAPTAAAGLDREEVVAAYEAASGREVADPLALYVFGLFKVAVIAQQIYQRFHAGVTDDPRFAGLLDAVRILASQARSALNAGRISGLGRAR